MKSKTSNSTVKVDFLDIFLESRELAPYYKTLTNSWSGNIVFQSGENEKKDGPLVLPHNCYHITDFLGYLKAEPIANDKGWKMLLINTFKGSCIDLTKYSGLEQYMAARFSSKRRSRLRSYQRRLENAFDIEYREYYGTISRDEYDAIFDQLHTFITKRFAEKGSYHHDLFRWKTYYEMTYPLLQKKQAVLFVIYDRKKPINIAVNLIQGRLMYAFIRGYDIDYSKFYPGFIDFKIQMRWAFDQDLELFDMLKGHYDYKKRLVDSSYFFQRQIIYNSNSFKSRYRAGVLACRIRLFYKTIKILKIFKVDRLYHRLNRIYQKQKYSSEATGGKYMIQDGVDRSLFSINNPLDIDSETFEYIRRPAFDFLYSSQQAMRDLKVFRSEEFPHLFLLEGIKQSRVISVPDQIAKS